MSKRGNSATIGAFVVGAIILVVVGVAYFGSGRFFSEKVTYVLFFDGSLQGLSVGAPVLFRGVKVGSVSDIVVRYHTERQDVDIPVYIELEGGTVKQVGDTPDPQAAITQMIEEKGLRAQLGVQSVVTGMLLIQLDFRPDTPIRLVGGDMEYPELPTIPSILEEITSTLDKIFKLPIPELVDDARRAIQGIDELARSEDLKKAIRDLDTTLQDFGKLARNVDEKIEPLTASVVETADAAKSTLRTAEEKVDSVERVLSETLRDYQKLAQTVDAQVDPVVSSFEESSVAARGALKQATQSLATVDQVIAPQSEVHFELVNALREISAAARSIRHLADYLEQHPEALLQGKGASGGK